MYSKDREDQAKAIDPMQKMLRKQFAEMEARGEVYTMQEPPNPERAEALKFLADEGQKCDRIIEGAREAVAAATCQCAEYAKTARHGRWECLECGAVWHIPKDDK